MKILKKINFYKNLYKWALDEKGVQFASTPIEIKEKLITFRYCSIQRVFWVNSKNKIHQIMVRVKKENKESIHFLDYRNGHTINDLYILTTNAITRAKRKLRKIQC